MKLPVYVRFHDMAHSDVLEASARDHAHRLELFAPDLMACRVGIDLVQEPLHQGCLFGVRIDLTLPGHQLVVSRIQHEEAYVALREAFDTLRRQMEDVMHRTGPHKGPDRHERTRG